MSANSADDSLLELVAKTTRDCQFDFNRAAEQVLLCSCHGLCGAGDCSPTRLIVLVGE